MLAALKVAGAHAFDPVRFHFLEALAERAQGQNAQVQQVVEDKLAQGLAEWSRRRAAWLATQGVVAVPMEGSASVLSAQAPAEATLDAAPTPLRALTRYLAHATQAGPDAEPPDTGFAHAQPELKSVRQFRSTWSRLSADRQLTLAMQQAPHNAGPINSHMLVLRSLALMRDISPDYLSRFVSYADTLLCLEAVEKPASARGEAQAGTGRPSKKRVPAAPGTLKRSKPRPSP
jgi:hypothetical protein